MHEMWGKVRTGSNTISAILGHESQHKLNVVLVNHRDKTMQSRSETTRQLLLKT